MTLLSSCKIIYTFEYEGLEQILQSALHHRQHRMIPYQNVSNYIYYISRKCGRIVFGADTAFAFRPVIKVFTSARARLIFAEF